MVINNKKAYYDYTILDEYNAGVVLLGTEVKSLRRGKASIKESYCYFKENELFIKGMHIAEHDIGEKHDPIRERKLLLTKKELKKLRKDVTTTGLTIIPTKVFFNKKGYAKIVIGLAKGKKEFNKKDKIKESDIDRDTSKTLNK